MGTILLALKGRVNLIEGLDIITEPVNVGELMKRNQKLRNCYICNKQQYRMHTDSIGRQYCFECSRENKHKELTPSEYKHESVAQPYNETPFATWMKVYNSIQCLKTEITHKEQVLKRIEEMHPEMLSDLKKRLNFK